MGILKFVKHLYPAGKIAEKAMWRSVFLCIWHCIFNADSTKPPSSSVTSDFPDWVCDQSILLLQYEVKEKVDNKDSFIIFMAQSHWFENAMLFK